MKQCCLRGRDVRTAPLFRPAVGEPTGEARKKCYARRFNDCRGPISKEHYFTGGILERLEERGAPGFAGLPWHTHPDQRTRPTDVSSNILCQKHNSMLSPLDSEAIRLYDAVCGEPGLFFFNGHDITRWLLKVSLGLLAAKAARTKSGELYSLREESPWLDVLFRNAPFPPGTGLYAPFDVDEVVNTRRFTMAPISLGDLVVGLEACIGIKLQLVTALNLEGKPPNPEATYQPRHFTMSGTGGRGDTTVVLTW